MYKSLHEQLLDVGDSFYRSEDESLKALRRELASLADRALQICNQIELREGYPTIHPAKLVPLTLDLTSRANRCTQLAVKAGTLENVCDDLAKIDDVMTTRGR